MANEKGKKYCITVSMVQSTDGDVDNNTVMEEYSEDGAIHAYKTQVFTKHILAAIDNITKEMTDAVLAGTLPE